MTLSDWFGPPAYNVSIACEKRKVIEYNTELIAFVLLFFSNDELVTCQGCPASTKLEVCWKYTAMSWTSHCVLLLYVSIPGSDPDCIRFLG
jgi:hypothetical protein